VGGGAKGGQIPFQYFFLRINRYFVYWVKDPYTHGRLYHPPHTQSY